MAVTTVLIRIVTDSGLIGYGEAKAPVVPSATREIVVGLLREVLYGCDPRDVAVHWDRLFGQMWLRGHRSGFLLEAIAGVDIALWDLIGRRVGEPISRLLGGAYRNAVPVYASGVPGLTSDDRDTHRIEESVATLAEMGYVGVKLGLGHGVALDVQTARAASPGYRLI